MTFAPSPDAWELQRTNPAYGGCSCDCHRIAGVKHVMACCWPGKESFGKVLCPGVVP